MEFVFNFLMILLSLKFCTGSAVENNKLDDVFADIFKTNEAFNLLEERIKSFNDFMNKSPRELQNDNIEDINLNFRYKRSVDTAMKAFNNVKFRDIEQKLDNIYKTLNARNEIPPPCSSSNLDLNETIQILEIIQLKVDFMNAVANRILGQFQNVPFVDDTPVFELDPRLLNENSDISQSFIEDFSKASDVCNNLYLRKYCDYDGFIVIQQRVNDKVSFNRSWSEYKNGFGNILEGNFWIGNEAIHHLTKKSKARLRVEFIQFNGDSLIAEYDHFNIGSESTEYLLKVSGYRGNATDSLSSVHNGMKFSTFDKVNIRKNKKTCPILLGGGWWFNNCYTSFLNGVYYKSESCHTDENEIRGSYWLQAGNRCPISKSKMSVKLML